LRRHYFSIDLLRGAAAVAVVFCHYEFFYGPHSGAAFALADPGRQPFYAQLWPLYKHGAAAVQLFWMISGFVFSAVYSDRGTDARGFFVQRFSRLYPLHFLTLLAMAGIQFWSYRALGYYQIFQYNDPYHFVLNLLFISSWGLARGASFNFPIWSVSVEIVIYWVFFLSLRVLFRRGMWGPVVATGLFWLLTRLRLPTPVAACGLYFFAGSCVFVFLKIARRHQVAVPLAVACIALAAIAPVGRLLLVCAGTILLLGYLDESYEPGAWRKWLAWIGESTYSIYLLGLPLQFALMTALDGAGVGRARLADNTWFLVCFLAAVFVLARLSFRYVERPLQNLLRRRLLFSRGATISDAQEVLMLGRVGVESLPVTNIHVQPGPDGVNQAK
jgi:peptidoglycan/LPS O-acetylase OafA/YrhL